MPFLFFHLKFPCQRGGGFTGRKGGHGDIWRSSLPIIKILTEVCFGDFLALGCVIMSLAFIENADCIAPS